MFIDEKQRKSGGLSLNLREHIHNTYKCMCVESVADMITQFK